jgi:hypothetical protein
MYLDQCKTKINGKTYHRVLLRESYRDKGKVKHRTIANLSSCSKEEIQAIELALKHKKDLEFLHETIEGPLQLRQGLSFGAVWLLYDLASRLGLVDALGSDRQGKLALWQVIARVIDQGSRLSAVRLAGAHAACDVLGLDIFNEDHLYANLAWLALHQTQIEQKLFQRLHAQDRPEVFLYDVTSSYLEGTHNALAAFGYNRDGKRGKMLCDEQGNALSIEVFAGDTSDPKTLGSQIQKVAQRFGAKGVTFVGDRGMIKGPQVEELGQANFHYITAITKPQMQSLLGQQVLQMELFDNMVAEVTSTVEGVRYILRRNPQRALEMELGRQSKRQALEEQCQELNRYLAEHPRAKVKTARKKLLLRVEKLKVADWIRIKFRVRLGILLPARSWHHQGRVPKSLL